jgi:thioredoxin
MKIVFTISLLGFLLNSCNNPQTANTNLSASDFANRIKEFPATTILDVRTPGEFAKGHIPNAVNYDWKGDEFEHQIAPLDKSKPVLIYCLSGGRSSAAAAKMRTEGFKEVWELDGGIMKWRSAKFPETAGNATITTGMSKQEFDALLNTDKAVLIDFYADWCIPCKKMKPFLDEISKEMADKVLVIRINADDNQTLCSELKIDSLPVLQLYKGKAITWSNTGFIEKADLVKNLN